MTTYIEKRARELLVRMEKAKRNERGHWCDARAAVDSACDLLPAIIAALTPPKGYVLVPVTATDAMLQALDHVGQFPAKVVYARYRAMLDARPEVP